MVRVYVDTSVIGGCLEDEFSEWSLRLMNEFRDGRQRMVLSELTIPGTQTGAGPRAGDRREYADGSSRDSARDE